MTDNINGLSSELDYKNFPHLYAKNLDQKIIKIKETIPPYFRGKRLLDVGCGTGLITKEIAKEYRMEIVHALELSDQKIEIAKERLINTASFKEVKVEQNDFCEIDVNLLYDLIMFIDILEKCTDPVSMLQKASRISIFSLICYSLKKSVINNFYKKVHSEDMHKIMRQGYEHIPHFDIDALKQLIEQGGLEIISSGNFRIPDNDQVLKKTLNTFSDKLCHLAAKGMHPNLFGDLYIAFCKSRNYQVIDFQTEKILLDTLKEYFGEDNLVSVCLFGSMICNTSKRHSDYDFTIILKDLPENIYKREKSSPELKQILRKKGITELCAFNLYTEKEFRNANKNNSWLIESMKKKYRILFDKNKFLKDIFDEKKEEIEEIAPFAWKNLFNDEPERFLTIAKKHKIIAEILTNQLPDIASYHSLQSLLEKMRAKAQSHNIFNSRGSIYFLGKILFHKGLSKQYSLFQLQQMFFEEETVSQQAMFAYEQTDKHLMASKILESKNYILDALFHAYMALKILYLEIMHYNNFFIVDGETTQLFVREFCNYLPSNLLKLILNNSFKAEQILGRCRDVSFDIDLNGVQIYEDTNCSYDHQALIANIRKIIEKLKTEKDTLINKSESNNSLLVSIVLATYNCENQLIKCLESLNKLIFPENKIDIVVVDDGSEKDYDIEQLITLSRFPLRYIKKEHSGVCATKNRGIQESKGQYVVLLDDDMVVSPLWMIHLLSGFKNENIVGVGSAIFTYPNKNSLVQYVDYRQLLRGPVKDKIGGISNLLTGSACVKRQILEEVGGFSQKQIEEGVTFGGDDVDLTWKIRNLGYDLNYVPQATVFHNHRINLIQLIKQHIGYGEGTMHHCLDKKRNPAELGIANLSYVNVFFDTLHYLTCEVPKRMVECYKNHLSIKNSIIYPFLDFCRKFFYNIGILKARKFLKHK